MALRARKGNTTKQRVSAAMRSFEVVGRRPILVGVLLAVGLLAMFAVKSPPTGAMTVRTPSRQTATTASDKARAASSPAVSPVTVTVPAGKTPPVSAPPVNARPVVTPPVGSAPPLSTPAAPGTQTLPGSAVPAPAAAVPAPAAAVPAPTTPSPASGRVAVTRHKRAQRQAGSAQQRLRSVVVRLSQCMSTLSPGNQRLLLLRAGITAGPDSSRAVARALRISVAREARVEHTALLELQTAAQEQRCGSTPAWVHVPVGDRLVLVDAVLTNSSQRARVTHASRHAPRHPPA